MAVPLATSAAPRPHFQLSSAGLSVATALRHRHSCQESLFPPDYEIVAETDNIHESMHREYLSIADLRSCYSWGFCRWEVLCPLVWT